jgi:hypothetical protein
VNVINQCPLYLEIAFIVTLRFSLLVVDAATYKRDRVGLATQSFIKLEKNLKVYFFYFQFYLA